MSVLELSFNRVRAPHPSRNDFFGPQAIAIMGGLTVATALTIFFFPALYAAWFKVGRTPQTRSPETARRFDPTQNGAPEEQPVAVSGGVA